MREPHAKKESLFLCSPLHSTHTKGVLKGISQGLLNKHWWHFCRIEDHIVEIQKNHIGLANRGHCPKELRALFAEVSYKL